MEWRIQRSRWKLQGCPRRNKESPRAASSTGTRAAPDPGAKGDSESRSVCLSGDLSSVDGQGVSLKDEDQLGI